MNRLVLFWVSVVCYQPCLGPTLQKASVLRCQATVKLRSGASRPRRSEKGRKRRLYGAIPSVSGNMVWASQSAAHLTSIGVPKGIGLPEHSLQVIALKRKPRLFSKHPSLQYQHSAAIRHPVGLCGVSVSCCCVHTHLGHCHLPAEPARSHSFHPWSPPCALLAHGGQPAALPDLANAGGCCSLQLSDRGVLSPSGIG